MKVHDMPARITFSQPDTPRERVFQIVQAVSERTGVEVSDIMDTSHRPHRVTRARWEAWTEMRLSLGWSYPRIGQFFRMDHSSVQYGVRKLALEKAAQEMEQAA